MACLTLTTLHPCWAAGKKQKPSSDSNPKYASIVVDATSGTVLSERYSSKKVYPASLTKVMTLLLVFDAMENGTVHINDRVHISAHAAAQQPSKLGLKAGSGIRVEDAILAVVTKSANDMAAALAEHIAGNESEFANRMTRRARSIGMKNTTFKNASGLPNPNQMTTARDMAIMARYVLLRHPNYYRYFGTKQFTYRGVTMTNHNRLMNSYPGMDGFKTGFINASGFNLIASAKRNGRRLIGVVFGGRSWKSRNDHMAELLNAGFKTPSTPSKAVLSVADAPPPEAPTTDVKMGKVTQSNSNNSVLPAQKPILNVEPAVPTREAAAPATGEISRSSKGLNQTLQLPTYYNQTAPSAAQAQQQTASSNNRWSVQIGAYSSKVATDDALTIALNRLPRSYTHATKIVSPMAVQGGYFYRARIGNLTKEEAVAACQYFRECLPLAP